MVRIKWNTACEAQIRLVITNANHYSMTIVASLRPLINSKRDRLVLNFLPILDLIPGHSLNHKL